MLSRRHFLKYSLSLGVGVVSAPVFARLVPPGERTLAFYNTHTGERLRATFWAEGQYVPDELAAIDRLLRDHRSGDVAPIDRALFDMLHALGRRLGKNGEIHVISGYRSPATNAMLRRNGGGVARGSLHTRGKAIDIRLPGVALSDLRHAALTLRAGGVGYYPQSDFIHLDTGRVRRW